MGLLRCRKGLYSNGSSRTGSAAPGWPWTPAVHALLRFLKAIEALLRDQLTETVELGARGVWPHQMLLDRGEDRFRRMELAWLAANRPALDDAMR